MLDDTEDFKKNSHKLKEVRISGYESFTTLLKLGGEITTSIKASEEIFKISQELLISESDIVELSMRFRLINGLLDEKLF